MNNEPCFCELAPLYALDLLTESERIWVEQQAAASPELAAELAELRATVGAIAYSAPPVPIAPNLKDRLFERLSQAPPEINPELPRETAQPDRRSRPVQRSGSRRWIQVGGVIAAIALVALLIDNYRLRQTAQTAKSTIETLQQPNTSVYSLRGTEKATNAAGSVLVNSSQNTVVVLAQNLPELPSGQAYRLWAIPKGATKPAYCGQFNSSAQSVSVRWPVLEAACGTATPQFLITAESATAPPVPAGTLVMKSVL